MTEVFVEIWIPSLKFWCFKKYFSDFWIRFSWRFS